MKPYQTFFLGILLTIWIGFLFWPTTSKPIAIQPYQNGYGGFVSVRGHQWILRVGTEDQMLDLLGMYGITDCANRKVYVHGSLDLPNQNNTITHELLHAGTCDEEGHVHNKFYNSDSDTDHEGIYKIADYFSTLLHDNPELAKHLYE